MRGRWLIGLVLLGLVAGCPRRSGRRDDPLLPVLAAIDTAWAARTTSFDDVDAAFVEALVLAPDDARVLWRLARLEIGRGMAAVDDRDAVRAYSRARDAAMRCLEQASGFSDRWAVGNYDGALASLPGDTTACADQAAFAWVRWLDAFGGDAGAWDLPRIDALLARWPPEPRADPGRRRPWASGVLAAARPEDDGRDLAAARTDLEKAVSQRPEDLPRLADLIRLVLDRTDATAAEAAREQLRQASAITPEDRRAKALILGVEKKGR